MEERADVAGAESEAGEVDSGLKRKRATSDDGAGTSKRVRHVSLGVYHRLRRKTPLFHPRSARSVEATSDSSAPVTHVVQSSPQTGPLTADDISRRDRETAKTSAGAQLRARFSSERSQSVQKDEEILLLKAEAESSRSYAQKLAEEKMALLVKVEQERANSADYKASCHWAVKYLEGVRTTILLGWMSFAREWRSLWRAERKLRKLVWSMMRAFTLTCFPIAEAQLAR
ncbi:hypothetical protein Tco_1265365 [Tanacetum coccineum]